MRDLGVDGARQAMMIGRLGQRGAVADRVFLGAERAAGHPPGRIVDAGHQRRERQLRAEPALPAAVDLAELARAGHLLTPAAVADRATPADGRQAGADRTGGPDGRQARLGQDPPEGPLRDDELLALGEQLRQMRPVDTGIGRRRQLDDPLADRIGDAMGRRRPWLPWASSAGPSR